MGKYDENLVKEEFNKFLLFLKDDMGGMPAQIS